jgi:hypothetical protein
VDASVSPALTFRPPVRNIAEMAFFGSRLTHVTLNCPQLAKIQGFQHCTSIRQIKIPSFVENIGVNGFFGYGSTTELEFDSGRHLREIDGFRYCTSLCRIEIPSSRLEHFGPVQHSLKSIHLKLIHGFHGCTSLAQIEIPLSVEIVGPEGFSDCTRLTNVRCARRLRRLEIPPTTE